jgi:uncharacterized protein (TIGR02246 family)
MKSRLLQLAVAAMLAFGSTLTHAQSTQGTEVMNDAAIQATIDANNAAVTAQSIEDILATYEPEAVLLSQPGIAAAGQAALRESFGYFLSMSPKIKVNKSEVFQADDIALHSYTWTMSGETPDGKAIGQSGLSVIVLRRQPDGRWLMVIDNPFGDRLLQRQ